MGSCQDKRFWGFVLIPAGGSAEAGGNKVFLGWGAPSQFLQWGRGLPLVSCRQGHGGHSKEQKELNPA